MRRIDPPAAALGLAAALALASLPAQAGAIGARVPPVFNAAIAEQNLDPGLPIADDSVGAIRIADGTAFGFDDRPSGNVMTVGFADRRVAAPHPVPGAYPAHTAASFEFLSGFGRVGPVRIAATSSPRSAPGNVLTWTPDRSPRNPSDTCTGTGADACLDTADDSPGVRIVRPVTEIAEPSQAALLGVGLLAYLLLRRKVR